MGETQLIIGTNVACIDGVYGRLRWIVVDPATRRVTHLAVSPSDLAPGRLVPADQVASAAANILLRCTTAELERFETTEEPSPGSASHDLGGKSSGVEGIEQDTGYGNLTTTRIRIPGEGSRSIEARSSRPSTERSGACREYPAISRAASG